MADGRRGRRRRRRRRCPAGHVRRRRRQQRRRASTELFRELGVQAVVAGGQTLNPSTAELLDAVERVNAEQVVVLPGNKNIIPVAEQLDALTTEDGARRADTLDARGARRADGLRPRGRRRRQRAADAPAPPRPSLTGEVTRAVRASEHRRPGRSPRATGSGIVRRRRHRRRRPPMSPARPPALLDHLVDDERELVTVIAGADADRRPRRRRSWTWLDDHRPGVEVEVHDGGQPLYPYLFGVE